MFPLDLCNFHLQVMMIRYIIMHTAKSAGYIVVMYSIDSCRVGESKGYVRRILQVPGSLLPNGSFPIFCLFRLFAPQDGAYAGHQVHIQSAFAEHRLKHSPFSLKCRFKSLLYNLYFPLSEYTSSASADINIHNIYQTGPCTAVIA